MLAGEGRQGHRQRRRCRVHGEGGDAHPAEEVVDAHQGRTAATPPSTATTSARGQGGKNVVDQAIDTFGSLDILVNNAGILRDKMSFNMDESDWDDVIRVHLKGHFAATHHAAVYWRNRAKAGEDVTGPHHQHVVGGRPLRQRRTGQLRRGQGRHRRRSPGSLARELGRYGVTVNAIAPRARTRMTENLFGDDGQAGRGRFDAWDPKNIANLVAFLAHRRRGRRQRADLRRLRRQHLRHGRLQARRPGHPRRELDARGTDRRQGRPLQGHRLRGPEVQAESSS